MSVKEKYSNANARQIAHDLVVNGTATDVYSDPLQLDHSDIWSTHIEWTDDSTTLAVTVSLWASNKADPDGAVADWVQMTASHGYDGLPGGNPAGGSGADLVDISASGALWYKWRFQRTAGTGTIQAYFAEKDRR